MVVNRKVFEVLAPDAEPMLLYLHLCLRDI